MTSVNTDQSRNGRLADFVGIFFLAMSTLLYEVTLTRIFSFTIWSNYAFLIVSTALFGFGVAGVFLSIARAKFGFSNEAKVPFYAFMFSILATVSLIVIIEVPLVVGEFDQFRNWVYLMIIFLALVAPFFFAGLAISILLSAEGARVHRLYFYDLAGAAIGSVIMVFIITPLGASGAILAASALGFLSAVIFGWQNDTKLRWVFAACLAASVILTPYGESILPIETHQVKRWYKNVERNILFSGWSTLSKVDVASFDEGRRRNIFINGGENESYLAMYDQKNPDPPRWEETTNIPYLWISGPGKAPVVVVIGSSGGTEVVYALSHGAKEAVGVEMDPLICRVVKHEFRDWNDDLFWLPNVRLVNDEGRSFIVNTDKKYDLIQMRNNFTPIAFASGAINLSETYLLTQEAMWDYINRLTDNGVLAFHRWGSIKICSIMREMAERRGIKDIYKNILVMSGENVMMNGFYYKKSPFTPEEIQTAEDYARAHKLKVLYRPDHHQDFNLYAKILKAPEYQDYFRFGGFNLDPSTDNRPFFDHFLLIGEKLDLNNDFLPKELKFIGDLLVWQVPDSLKSWLQDAWIPLSEVPLLAIAIEATLVSLLGMFLPLLIFGKKGRDKGVKKWPAMVYFSILGMAFIMIELCYIKHYILFLGDPAMSIALIIAFLLLFTGLGSHFSERFGDRPMAALKKVFVAIFLVNAVSIVATPLVFQIFLGHSLMIRILVTACLVAPMGILMGLPFPLGLRILHQISPDYVGWAWGINGFMTVVGSIATVFISLYLGFHAVLWAAGTLYLLNGLVVSRFVVPKK